MKLRRDKRFDCFLNAARPGETPFINSNEFALLKNMINPRKLKKYGSDSSLLRNVSAKIFQSILQNSEFVDTLRQHYSKSPEALANLEKLLPSGLPPK